MNIQLAFAKAMAGKALNFCSHPDFIGATFN